MNVIRVCYKLSKQNNEKFFDRKDRNKCRKLIERSFKKIFTKKIKTKIENNDTTAKN